MGFNSGFKGLKFLQIRIMEQPGRDGRRGKHVMPSSSVLTYNHADGTARNVFNAVMCGRQKIYLEAETLVLLTWRIG